MPPAQQIITAAQYIWTSSFALVHGQHRRLRHLCYVCCRQTSYTWQPFPRVSVSPCPARDAHMSFLLVQLAKDVGEPLHHSQHDCSPQEGRRLGYQPPPFDQTPCYLNEKTCTKHYAHTSWGSNITITFDWKHMMYEDYDRALFRWDKEGGPHYLFTSPGQALGGCLGITAAYSCTGKSTCLHTCADIAL